MRSFIDEEGKIAWVFDEETHPRGKKFADKKEATEEVVEKKEKTKGLFGKVKL